MDENIKAEIDRLKASRFECSFEIDENGSVRVYGCNMETLDAFKVESRDAEQVVSFLKRIGKK